MRMATYASRPAWELRARAVSSARVAAPLGIGLLIAVSVLLRTRQLDVGFWIDEGLSVGIADRPLTRHPRRAAPGRLAAALLPAAQPVAGRRRALGGERARALGGVLRALRAGRVLGRLVAVRPPDRLDRGAARRGQPVPHAVRAGGADVRARRAARAGEPDLLAARVHDGCRCRRGGARRSASRSRSPRCSTPTTGRCSSARRRGSRGSSCCGGRAATSARRLLRTGLLAYGGVVVLYAPWIPNTLYQAAHTGAPWSKAPSLAALASVPARMLGEVAEVAVFLAAGAGVVALLRAGGPRARAAPRCSGSRCSRSCWPGSARSSRPRGRTATWRPASRRSCCSPRPASRTPAGSGSSASRSWPCCGRSTARRTRRATSAPSRTRSRRRCGRATSSSRRSPSRSRCSTTTCPTACATRR